MLEACIEGVAHLPPIKYLTTDTECQQTNFSLNQAIDCWGYDILEIKCISGRTGPHLLARSSAIGWVCRGFSNFGSISAKFHRMNIAYFTVSCILLHCFSRPYPQGSAMTPWVASADPFWCCRTGPFTDAKEDLSWYMNIRTLVMSKVRACVQGK